MQIIHPVDRLTAALKISQQGLGEIVGVSKGAVGQWKSNGIPAEHCSLFETIAKETSDPISRIEMRPKDWQKYWPELAQKKDEAA